MMKFAFPAAAAALLLAVPAVAQTPSARLATSLCRLGYKPVPLQVLASGHQVVAATVNGVAGTFIVDTGAGATIVHQPVAARFGLAAAAGGRAGVAIGATGRTGVAQLAPATVTLGGLPLGHATLFSADIGSVVDTLNRVLKVEVHGVVGQDLLRANAALVDVGNNRLFLRRNAIGRQRC